MPARKDGPRYPCGQLISERRLSRRRLRKLPLRISDEDLAAGRYPKGDVRNEPHVRAWMEATAKRPLDLKAVKTLDAVEQIDSWIWHRLADELERRTNGVHRDRTNRFPLRSETLDKLSSLAADIRRDLLEIHQ